VIGRREPSNPFWVAEEDRDSAEFWTDFEADLGTGIPEPYPGGSLAVILPSIIKGG